MGQKKEIKKGDEKRDEKELRSFFSFASSSHASSSSHAFLSRENARSTWKNHNRGKEERWRTTKARSFSSSQSNEKKKKKPNPRMSIVEAVSAAIGSFVIGSLAAYLI